MTSQYDVLIVGAGMAGSWAAKQLCEAGLSVALIEAGLPAFPPNSPEEWTPQGRDNDRAPPRQLVQSQHPAYWTHDPHYFVDDRDNPYVSAGPEPFVWIRGRQVGGRSLTWGGVTLRFSEHELRLRDGPPWCAGWPISYAELEPFYALVEEFLQVKGSRDGVRSLPDGVFSAPPRLADAELQFRSHVESRWGGRRVLQSRGICKDDSLTCGDSRWPATAMQHRVLPAALNTGRLDLLSGLIVSNLVVSDSGSSVLGVSCVNQKTAGRVEFRGRATALCASTIETVRLLLNSRCAAAPHGLGNSRGCVGRYLVDHAATVMVGKIPGHRVGEPLPIGGPHGVVVPGLRTQAEMHPGCAGSYGLWGSMGRLPWPDSVDAMWVLSAMLEVLPRKENRITIEPGVVDRWGIPAPRIDFRYSAEELRMRAEAEESIREMVESLGWTVEQKLRMMPGQFVHELGGARMGDDPSESVVNRDNQCWDIPNLFVLDGAVFATSGWQNPTLTILALATRACQLIVSKS